MAVWKCEYDGMYLVEGFSEAELGRINDALNDLENSHGTAPSITSKLKNALKKETFPIKVLQQLSKWCHSGRSYSSSVEKAVKVSKLLFNGIPLPKLVDQQDEPLPEYKGRLDKFYVNVKASNSTTHTKPFEEKKTMNKTIKTSLNTILYGPPGTGKTYKTKEYAVQIIKNNGEEVLTKDQIEELYESDQIEFVTFHPSYSYEDFVEGIRPVIRENDVGSAQFEHHEGIFKEICRRAFDGLMKFINEENKDAQHGMEQQGVSIQETNSTPNNKPFDWKLSKLEQRELHNQTRSLKDNVVKWAKVPKYVLIIDEINRGDISKIFGELITLIEPDKRLGCNNKLTTRLPYTKHLFAIPPNLYILGTMNTADRSLALIDIALRRRFDFEEMIPDFEALSKTPSDFGVGESVEKSDRFKSSINAALRLNELLGKDPDIGKDKKIGHAFFCNLENDSDIEIVWKKKIFPLLEEYFYFDKSKLEAISGGCYTLSNGWNNPDKGLEVFIKKMAKNNDTESIKND